MNRPKKIQTVDMIQQQFFFDDSILADYQMLTFFRKPCSLFGDIKMYKVLLFICIYK